MSKKETRMGAAKSVVAVTGLVAVFGAAAGIAAPATAEDSTTSTSSEALSSTVRKSISMSGDADGTINSTQMVTQVSAVGDGQMTVNVPIGADSVRNLDGFGSIPVESQSAVFNLNVNGSEEQRTLSAATQDVLSVKTIVTLDGKPIDPDDVVGKTGLLDVQYTVVNSGTSTQTVTFQNARGETITQEQEVNLPIGGSIDIDLPQGFNEITAKGANIGGDGMGQTTLGFSVVLFKPLGDPVATFGYQARITDGTIPAAKFTFLPIVPLDNPSVVTAEAAFKGGAAVGTQIYEAGVGISKNLVTLQDGAAKLLVGLETAATGAATLEAGVTGTLTPGAELLADGTETLLAQVKDLVPSAEDTPEYKQALKALNGLLSYFDVITAFADGGTVAGQAFPGLKSIGKDLVTAGEGVAAGGALAIAGGEELKVRGGLLADGGTVQKTQMEANGVFNNLYDKWCDVVPVVGIDQSPTVCKLQFDASARIPLLAGGEAVEAGGNELKAQGDVLAKQGEELAAAGALIGAGGAAVGLAGDGLDALMKSGVPGVAPGAIEIVDDLIAQLPGLLKLIEDELLGAQTGSPQGVIQLNAGMQALADNVSADSDFAKGVKDLADGLPAAVTGIEQAEQGAIDLREQGSDKLAATGETAEEGYALQVGQINALQQVGLAGTALPYGPATATGGAVNTSGVYQLTLQAAPSGASNSLVFGLAALGLIAGGAVGVWAYRRRVV